MSTAGSDAPQVAWIAIEEGAAIVAADGSQFGTVKEVAGDEEHDIFDGLVLSCHGQDGDRYVAAERVQGIWPARVETSLSPTEAASLPPYQASKQTVWRADEGGGFGTRLKRAWNALLGRRG